MKIQEWLCGLQKQIKRCKNFRLLNIFLKKELDLVGYLFSFYKALTCM